MFLMCSTTLLIFGKGTALRARLTLPQMCPLMGADRPSESLRHRDLDTPRWDSRVLLARQNATGGPADNQSGPTQ